MVGFMVVILLESRVVLLTGLQSIPRNLARPKARVEVTRLASRLGFSVMSGCAWNALAITRPHAVDVHRAAPLEATRWPSGSGRWSWWLDRERRELLAGCRLRCVMIRRELPGEARKDAAREGQALARASACCLTLRHGSAIRHGVVTRAVGGIVSGHRRSHGARLGHRHAGNRHERQGQRDEDGQDCAKSGHDDNSTVLAMKSFHASTS